MFSVRRSRFVEAVASVVSALNDKIVGFVTKLDKMLLGGDEVHPHVAQVHGATRLEKLLNGLVTHLSIIVVAVALGSRREEVLCLGLETSVRTLCSSSDREPRFGGHVLEVVVEGTLAHDVQITHGYGWEVQLFRMHLFGRRHDGVREVVAGQKADVVQKAADRNDHDDYPDESSKAVVARGRYPRESVSSASLGEMLVQQTTGHKLFLYFLVGVHSCFLRSRCDAYRN